MSAEEYARQVLEHDFAPDWLRRSWESAAQAGLNRLSMDDIDAEIAAARTTFQPRLTIRVVLDTIVIVSALLQPLAAVFLLVAGGAVQLCIF